MTLPDPGLPETALEPPGERELRLTTALDAATVQIAQLQGALITRMPIEQAKGYVAAHARVSTAAAFTALRTYSRNRNLKLHQVCVDLVAGTLPDAKQVMDMARREDRSRARHE